jgi:NADH dehydrogenase [ubiquinone] 1 alpha subcomplex assembly factor 7
VQRGAQGWQERVIVHGADGFAFDFRPAPQEILRYLPRKTVSGAIHEIAPSRDAFIRDCAAMVHRAGGAALFIDYGYGQSAAGDTLQAVRGHQYCGVLEDIGNADLTAHVDFEAAQSAARACYVCCADIVSQREFLLRLGIGVRAEMLQKSAVSAQQRQDIGDALERLTGRDKMGDLFKILCFYKEDYQKPVGF